MAINESIWGSSTDWSDVMHSMAKRLTSPMYTLLDNTLTLNERVDNSVCFCGAIQDKYTWHKANPLLLQSQNDSLELFEQEEVTNMLWLWTAGGNQGDFKVINWTNNNNRWAEYNQKSDIQSYYFNANIRPIFNIKINKLLLLPSVIAFRTTDPDESYDDPYSMSLATWIDSGHTTYPYLATLKIEPYVNVGTDNTPDWRPAYDSYDHYFLCTANSELTEDAKSLGSQNQTINYSLGGYASWKFTDCIMGINTDFSPYWFSGMPYGFDKDFSHYISSASKIRYCREYSEDLIEEIRHQLAFFGVFFIGDKYTGSINTLTLTHNSVYCGIIDENGYTHGDYSHGSDNEDRQQFTWEDSSESNYDPDTPPPPPNNWSNDFPTKYSVYAKYLANHWYLFDDSDLYKFFAEVNNVDLSTLDKNATYGLNPIDGVLQVKRIFANFTTAKNHLSTIASQYTKIGSLQLDIGSQIANVATFNETYTKDCGTKYAGEIYPDFRSYAPFSSICFYDAFCGVIELQPEKVLNKYITVEQTIDLLLGDKITSVYASPDGSVNKRVRIATLHGNCAEDIPVNGQAVADYQRNKYILTQQKTQQEFTTAGRFAMGVGGATISAVEGNFVGAIAQVIGAGENLGAGITGIKTTEQLIEHTIPSIVRVSQGSSNVEDGVIFPPMLIIFPPKMLESYNESEYADKAGFSGYKIDTLANCGVGTHIVSHPRIEISGTSSEMYTIVDQLQKGIYVKPILE